jgi:glycosyltransferase involved in cell wall biosynthesis
VRVVQVSPTAFGEEGIYGGGERYPLQLARALAREVDCELVTFGRTPYVLDERDGLRIRVLRHRGCWRHHPANPIAPGLPAALTAADVVHTHHLRSVPSRVAALAGVAPLAVTDHGLGGGGWLGLLPRLFDRFLTVSRFSAETLNVPAERTQIIYGGADTSFFRPNLRSRREGVLFVGRLTPHKGLDRLIRALPEDVPLTVVGTAGHDRHPPESGYPGFLERLAEGKCVRFLGPVSDTRMADLYRRAGVVVVPSVHRTCYGREVAISELLGLTALEAMASGTPVICSRLGGLPEIVRDGETGLLAEPGGIAELRDRIGTVLADRALARRLGENARRLVLERFTWERCAQRCLAAYTRMLEPPH